VKRLALASLLCAAACSSGAPAPVVSYFTATPATVPVGGTATLAWSVTGATEMAIDQGIGQVQGTSTVVRPQSTTTYTFSATGTGGTTTAKVTVVVDPSISPPAITAFTASPSDVARGSSSVLSWTVKSASSVSISPDPGGIAGSQVTVTPQQTTTYTLTATGTGGLTATASVVVTVHDPVLHLVYADPPASTNGVRLVQNTVTSTATRLVLELRVGPQAVQAFGAALNLPFDITRAQLSATAPFTPNASAIDPGTGPTLAVANVPASGPLQNALVLGVARKKQFQSDGDLTLAANTLIFTLALDAVPNAPAGVVFDGTHPGAKFDAGLVKADGTRSVNRDTFAIGTLSVAY
jgi:hypothetical protein